MRARRTLPLARIGSALALALMLAACTKGGQFDPTELFNNDMFDTKKKLSGQREPLFPNGVPGTSTGVPPELMQGYQPPPDQTDTGAAQASAEGGAQSAAASGEGGSDKTAAAAKPKPKTKPKAESETKPKVARAPAQSQDPVWNQAPGGPRRAGPTRISVGPAPKPAAPAQSAAPAASAAPPANTQSPWPDPTPPSSAVETRWPSPPSADPAQQQTAQPSQSVWPAPPATSTQ
jgi:hypothetical protein